MYVYVEEDDRVRGGSNIDILVWVVCELGKQDGWGKGVAVCALCKWSARGPGGCGWEPQGVEVRTSRGVRQKMVGHGHGSG